MVRALGWRRMEPGTTFAPTLKPTFSTKVVSAAVFADSSAGVRKYTPVCFTPSVIRNPTLLTMTAALNRNLWPAFMGVLPEQIQNIGILSFHPFASASRASSRGLGCQGGPPEVIERGPMLGVLGSTPLH